MKFFWNTFGGALIFTAIVLAAAFFWNRPGGQDYEIGEVVTGAPEALILLEKKLDINTAGREDLTVLSGIGPAIAGRIVEYRAKHGKFRSVEELDNVKGIGEKTVEKLREFVEVR